MINRKRLVSTLQELVRIPSHEDCGKISEYIANEVRSIGIKPEVDSDGNILASIGSGRGLVLNSHMDTVGVKGYDNAFSGEIIEDKLYGRGSTDNKSGVAAMLEIMRALKESPPNKRIIFAFTVWEESGDPEKDGAYKIAKNLDASHGIVLESSMKESGVVSLDTGCKGRLVYRLDVIGRSAHSGRPSNGMNAIYLAADLVRKIRDFKSAQREFPGIGVRKSFLSVTEIDAREGSNVIPGKCTLTLDYRALPGEREKDVTESIKSICKRSIGDSFNLTLVESKNGFVQTDPEYQRIFEHAVSSSGSAFEVNLSSGWFDAAVFNDAGITTFNLGPGTKGQAHRTPEYCWIPGLIKGTEIILNVIRRWDANEGKDRA